MDDRYAPEVMVDSPIRHFRLFEPSGNFVDVSGGFTATVAGTMLYARRGPWRGQRSLAAGFAGVGYASLARVGLSAAVSFEAWVRTLSTDATYTYEGNTANCVFGDSTANVWMGFGVHGGKVRFSRFNNVAWQHIESDRLVNDGGFHQIGASYDSSSRAVEIIVDGVVCGTGTITAHQAQGGVDRIGAGYNGASDIFDGDIADAAFYNTVLPSSRFRAHFLAGKRLFLPERRGRGRAGLLAA